MHLDDPIDKNCSHSLIYVILIFHVFSTILALLSLHILQNWSQVLCDVIDIVFLALVDLFNVLFLHLIDGDDMEIIESSLNVLPVGIRVIGEPLRI